MVLVRQTITKEKQPMGKIGSKMGFQIDALMVVQTQAILFLKSMSKRIGSDIERL